MSDGVPWMPPESGSTQDGALVIGGAARGGLPPAGPPAAGAMNYDAGAPLGGTPPTATPRPQRSDRRDLALTAVLLVAAIVAGATSLMPWRDYGRRFGATVSETGWLRPDGSMGRGWWFVLLGVALAVAGVLIAGGRRRPGRMLAAATGAVMVLSAIVEWGLGDGGSRSGPGPGLWVELVVGVVVIVAVGVLEPAQPVDQADGRS